MRLSGSYRIVHREAEILLCNIENGDIYKINDVTAYVLSQSQDVDVATPTELARSVYAHFKETPGDFSLSDMHCFIQQLITDGIIVL